ncbi:MAG: gluconate 5-dehydrogenase [Cyclobacteriaceae bacterium]|nr:gluconate 5-dehydrogenase [Cyclobacteriaceae bacterium]
MSIELFSLAGKTALITGGTHGIGLAIAEGLAASGARIILNGHTAERLSSAVGHCEKKGFSVSGYLFDISDQQAVDKNLEKIRKMEGVIDVLVNNAAIHRRVKLMDLTLKDFRLVLDINLTAQFYMAQQVARSMINNKQGKIINLCSMMSELGRDTTGAYASAKGGLKMLTKSMATEWAQYNIQVNGIGPGYIKTDATGPISEPGSPLYDFIISRTPAGRWGKPEDLKGAAIFLASSASDFVNGHILYVDGGMLATLGRPTDE